MAATEPAFTSPEAAARQPQSNLARPKVLRRPAQFGGSATSASSAAPSGTDTSSEPSGRALALLPTASSQPERRPWQEDARFGLFLFGMIAATNLLLMVWLPGLKLNPVRADTVDIRDAANLQPTRGRAAPVTLYAQPDNDWRSSALFDMRQIESSQNALSVSPADVPVPRAQALVSEP